LLLDEPAAGLGDDETAELGALIRRLAADYGVGIGLIEHDMALIMSACDRVLVLNGGRVLVQATPQVVASDAAVITAYLGGTPDAAAEAA
jgi:sulfate-transporting ATPase